MNGNNKPQLGMQAAGKTGNPRFDFGGIKPKDYDYTGMQAVGDIAGQLLRVGKPFAEATKINMGIEEHERDMANKERVRSLGVATQQLGGIISRANSHNATIFNEINRTPEAQEFIGGKLDVTDTGKTRDGNKLYSFNILDPKTGQSINEIQATTAEAVNMFDGMLAPEMQRGVRETARTMDKARKRIRAAGDKIGAGKGNIFDMMAEGIPLTSEMQDTFNTFFADSSLSQQEIMAQLISDEADEIELKKERAAAKEKRETAEEKRKVAEEKRKDKRLAFDERKVAAYEKKAGKEGKATAADKPEKELVSVEKSGKLWSEISKSDNLVGGDSFTGEGGRVKPPALSNFNALQKIRKLPLKIEKKDAEGNYSYVSDVSIYVDRGDKFEESAEGKGVEYIRSLPAQTQEEVVKVLTERQKKKAGKLKEKRKGKQKKANVKRKARKAGEKAAEAARKRNILYKQVGEAIGR